MLKRNKYFFKPILHSLIYTALYSYRSLLITTSIPCACVVHVLFTRHDNNKMFTCHDVNSSMGSLRASNSQSASAAILNTNYFSHWMGMRRPTHISRKHKEHNPWKTQYD